MLEECHVIFRYSTPSLSIDHLLKLLYPSLIIANHNHHYVIAPYFLCHS